MEGRIGKERKEVKGGGWGGGWGVGEGGEKWSIERDCTVRPCLCTYGHSRRDEEGVREERG